jgi:hypothetical protein
MPTAAQTAELNRETSAHALLSFVEVTHPALPGGVLRHVTDVLPFVWGGETWTPIGQIELPLADDAEDASRLRVTIPNIDKMVGQTIRRIGTRMKVAQHILSSADFNLTANPRTEVGTATAFYSMENFETVDAQFDAVAGEVSLVLRDYSQAQYGLYATQSLLPGVRR